MASGSAGSIYVDLLLRDAQYKQGLSRSQKNTKNFTSSVKKEFSGLGRVIGGAFVSLSAGVLFSKFIQNTIQAQKEQAQLAAVLRSTGNAAGYTSSQLNAMASALSENSIFSSGEITSAQTRLLSYVGIVGKNIPQAMQAVIDQSARLGISLEQSAETIGRALEQPSKAAAALSRQGFGSYFTKETIEMLKALERQGKVAEAQVKILEVLNESYAGAAKAARDTLGGALSNLNNTINDLTTSERGFPELTFLVNGLSDSLRAAAKEGGVFNSLLYRMSIGVLEFKRAYNEMALTVVQKTNIFGLNNKNIEEYQKKIQDAIGAQNELTKMVKEGYGAFSGYGSSSNASVDFSRPSLPTNNPQIFSQDESKLNKLSASYEKYESIIRGVSENVISLERAEKDLNELRKSGRISQDEMTLALERYKNQLDKTNIDLDTFAKRASENIQDAFAEFLFDPFQDGLKGMAKGFIDTVRKMIAEAQAAQLAKYLFGENGGGASGTGDGILGGVFKNVFGSVFDGLFADGGNIKPGHFGIAGEEGPEIIMGGNSGKTVIPLNGNGNKGNTYNIDARGADMSAVRRLEQALLSLAGPGVIEQRVQNGQVRGKI